MSQGINNLSLVSPIFAVIKIPHKQKRKLRKSFAELFCRTAIESILTRNITPTPSQPVHPTGHLASETEVLLRNHVI